MARLLSLISNQWRSASSFPCSFFFHSTYSRGSFSCHTSTLDPSNGGGELHATPEDKKGMTLWEKKLFLKGLSDFSYRDRINKVPDCERNMFAQGLKDFVMLLEEEQVAKERDDFLLGLKKEGGEKEKADFLLGLYDDQDGLKQLLCPYFHIAVEALNKTPAGPPLTKEEEEEIWIFADKADYFTKMYLKGVHYRLQPLIPSDRSKVFASVVRSIGKGGKTDTYIETIKQIHTLKMFAKHERRNSIFSVDGPHFSFDNVYEDIHKLREKSWHHSWNYPYIQISPMIVKKVILKPGPLLLSREDERGVIEELEKATLFQKVHLSYIDIRLRQWYHRKLRIKMLGEELIGIQGGGVGSKQVQNLMNSFDTGKTYPDFRKEEEEEEEIC